MLSRKAVTAPGSSSHQGLTVAASTTPMSASARRCFEGALDIPLAVELFEPLVDCLWTRCGVAGNVRFGLRSDALVDVLRGMLGYTDRGFGDHNLIFSSY